jgi:hypothetical protein
MKKQIGWIIAVLFIIFGGIGIGSYIAQQPSDSNTKENCGVVGTDAPYMARFDTRTFGELEAAELKCITKEYGVWDEFEGFMQDWSVDPFVNTRVELTDGPYGYFQGEAFIFEVKIGWTK